MKTGWWFVKFESNLEGEEVRWEDLSEATQEHIAEMIKDGYSAGEIVEEIADVEIMLEQIKHLMSIHPDEINDIKMIKIIRTTTKMEIDLWEKTHENH